MLRVTSASVGAGNRWVSRGWYAMRTLVPTRGSRFSEHCAAPPERDFSRIQRWHPHQLRHNYATMIRKRFGIEEASNMLDHSSVSMTEVYAERNREQAMDIANKVG